MAQPQELAVAMVGTFDVGNVRKWSGTPFYMARALEDRLGPVLGLGDMPRWPANLARIRARLLSRIDGGRRLPGQEEGVARVYGRTVARRLAALTRQPDLVFSPAGSVLLSRLETDLPVVYSSDATARVMFDYYPRFTGLTDHAREMADRLERDTITRADLLLYPTRWAADSAIRDYGADPERVHVIFYGANLSEVPPAPDPEAHPAPGPDRALKLLFVGVNWQIKGGAIAVEALEALQAQGVRAELTIVGCAPPEPIQRPGLTFIPFLDKNDPGDRARLGQLYREADFFILPSRCECYGIVFCEAAAYGLPALSTRTGGIPEVVAEGRNGFTFPPEARGDAYAERALALWRDPAAYRALRQSSRAEFDQRLNWGSWGEQTAGVLRHFIARRRQGRAA